MESGHAVHVNYIRFSLADTIFMDQYHQRLEVYKRPDWFILRRICDQYPDSRNQREGSNKKIRIV